MLEFHLDNREHALVSRLEGCTVSQLAIGDFQAILDGVPRLLIERKTLADLEASVKDARYKEQKLRSLSLRATTGCKLLYLIEGAFRYSDGTHQHKINTSCVINSMVRDEIPFVFVKDVEESATFLSLLMSRLVADPDKYFKKAEGTADYIDTVVQGHVKMKKKDNVDSRTCFVIQLCAIPGISMNKAEAIIQGANVTSMASLCAKMALVPPKAFFKDVPGIGKVLQNNIYRFCGVDTDSN